jgi:toxin-antitoxin system PIN domain toxin
MIAVDTNILLYAHRDIVPEHKSALAAMMGLAASGEAWGIPWPCVHEFISIATHPRVYQPPGTLVQALGAIDAWLVSPQCRLLGEGPGYWDELKDVALKADIAGPKIHDARIAALCLHHGVRELWTCDRDFSRFPRLKTRNPLVR